MTAIKKPAAKPLVRWPGLQRQGGRIVTDSHMSPPGHSGLWAIRDCTVTANQAAGLPAPPKALFTIAEARRMAANMNRHIARAATRPVRLPSRGPLASIGRNKTVAEMFGLRVSGFVGRLLWRGFYLLKIPTLLRKIGIFFEWNREMLFPPDIAHLRFTRSPGANTPPEAQTPSTSNHRDPK